MRTRERSCNGPINGLTWIDPEDRAYPAGGFTRRGCVRLERNREVPQWPGLPYGALRMVRLSIPDTYFSIPARFRWKRHTITGFVSVDTDGDQPVYTFTPTDREKYERSLG